MNEKLINRIFAYFSALYGQKWTSLVQNDDSMILAVNVWGKTLDGIEPETIKSVLEKLPAEYPNWPPTVGQFLALCKVGHDPAMHPQLPKPRGDEQIALDALEQMKEILK